MTFLAAFALSNLKHDLGALWSWLCRRSFWQLVSGALAIYAVVQYFQIADARHDAANYKKQRDDAQAELRRISTAKNEQKAETSERIKVVNHSIQLADKVARKIEVAPLPGGCKSPKEVLDADL